MPITKIQITPPAGRVIDAKILQNGSWELLIEVTESERKPPILDSDLVLIDAENLSMEDKFMQHKPRNNREMETKELIKEAIKKGVKNFWKPKGDISLTDDENGICYVPGKMPAVGKSYDWNEKAANEFWPERNSRLGSKLEYGAFLGVLIKKLIEEGKTVEWAWAAVCCDSRELGHYRDSLSAKYYFEATGSREICGLCDLANAYKILAWDIEADGYWLAGGCYKNCSCGGPLADLYLFDNRFSSHRNSVGWLVLS